MIKVNRQSAEAIVKERLRSERALILESLDVQFMRAIEQGADTSAIVAEKQALRDVTDKDLSSLDIESLSKLTLAEALLLAN